MALDLRPFPNLPTSLLTMVVWAVGLALLTATLATTRHISFPEAAVRYKIVLTMFGFIAAFHAMAGVRAAQLIAGVEVVALALLWLLARTLPPRAHDDEEPVDSR